MSTDFFDAIKACNEKIECTAVRQWNNHPTRFHTCRYTRENATVNGIVYVQLFAGYRKLSGKVMCENLFPADTKGKDAPTAVEECNRNDDCVGVKDINDTGEEVLQCKHVDKKISASTTVTGTTYQRECVTKKGRKCEFPFTYKGNTYSDCTSEFNQDWLNTGFWCSTNSFYLGRTSLGKCAAWGTREAQLKNGISILVINTDEVSSSRSSNTLGPTGNSKNKTSTLIMNTDYTSSARSPNTVGSRDSNVMGIDGVYIYEGCTIFLVTIASAIMTCFAMRRKRHKNTKKITRDETNYEEDGYDCIGQLDIIPQTLDDATTDENIIPVSQNDDLNAILASRNPYHEGSLDINGNNEASNTIQIGTRSTECVTKMENPYYEGI